MTLSRKLLLSFSWIGLVVTVTLTIMVYSAMRTGMEKSVGLNQAESANQVMDTIDRLLYERYIDIGGIGEASVFGYLLQGETSEAVAASRLAELQETTGPWDILTLVDKDGKIAASTFAEEVGKTINNGASSYVAHNRAMTGVIYYSDYVISEDTGKPVIVFAAPIRESDSTTVIGTAIGQLSWPVVVESLVLKESSAHLYDKHGRLIAAAEAGKELSVLGTSNYSHQSWFEKAAKGNSGYELGLYPWLSKEMQKQQQQQTKSNAQALVSYTDEKGYLAYKGNGWVLTLEQPVLAAFKDVRSASVNLGLLFVGLILTLFAGSLWLLHKLVIHPLKGLSATSAAIAAGDLNRRAEAGSDDEIGQLAKNFNYMAGVLVDANTQNEALLGSIGDGVFALNADGEIILFNSVASELTGFSQKEALGKPYGKVLQFLREDNGEHNDGFIAIAMKGTRTSMSNHTVVVRKDGKTVPVADSAAPILDRQGAVTGVIVVFRDVTKEHQLEQAKDEFVSLASHQLRTPATAVKQFIGMMLEGYTGKVTKEQKAVLQDAYDSNERQLGIVEDLLNVARADAGRIILQKQETELGQLLEAVIAEQKSVIESRKQTMTYAKPATAVAANVDPGRLRMVLENLVSNASKYTPEQGRLRVTIEQTKQRIQIAVADSGVGIAKADIPKLFNKFARIDNELSTKVGGTGLGLYLAKNIVDLHKGELKVTSQAGKGTTFTVVLPK